MKETSTSSCTAQEDAALVRTFQAGNKSAFDTLVIRHKDRIFSLCYWVMGDYQEANDAAQDTFIKAYGGLRKFRFEAAFSTWLHKIAMNTCKNRLGSAEFRRRKNTVPLDCPAGSQGGSRPAEIEDPSASPMMELEKKEKTARIKKAVDALPREHKTVVVLRDIQGMSYEEIAKVTGLNLGTVKSRLARARMDLKNKLGRAR